MIIAGPFCELIKQGIYFSVDNDDRLFTGDLFFDIAKKEFQLRGIPSWQGKMSHAVPVTERGPFSVMLLVQEAIEVAPRMDGKYSDIRFKKAKAASALVVWLEEWYVDRSVAAAATELWEVLPNLAWVKG
jgi:hypothetical protein